MANLTYTQIGILENLKSKFAKNEIDFNKNLEFIELENCLMLYFYQQYFSINSDELDFYEILDNVVAYIPVNVSGALQGDEIVDFIFSFANRIAGTDEVCEMSPLIRTNYFAILSQIIKIFYGYGYNDDVSEEDCINWQLDIYNAANLKFKNLGFRMNLNLELIKVE